jgi:Protein of unknown function (DUF1566).
MKRLYILPAVVLLMVITGCNGSWTDPTPAPLSSEKAITAFSLAGVIGTINEAGKTIAVTMPFGTNVTALVATFTTTGASVKVGSTVQISGTTANNFTAPVAYTVTAADDTTVIYTVTVTVAAPVAGLPKTGQTTSYATGDDGDLEKGIAWPDPRFTDNGGTITDNLTGLMWSKDANPAGATQTWQQALDYIKTLNSSNYLGYNDWRLPNRKELKSMVNYGQSDTAAWLTDFNNVQPLDYWSSTTCAADIAAAWFVNMSDGLVFNAYKISTYNYVWPVRAGQAGTVDLPQTGQTTSYATGDDGDLQKGVAWPSLRFTNNSDGTITDNLTGLMWTQDGNAPGPAGCTPGVAKNTPDALAYVACLNTNNYLEHSDWRLPNVNELESLVHYGESNPSAWLNAQGFTTVQTAWYRSSTTNASDTTSYAWVVMMGNGNVDKLGPKANPDRVWPVRGGQNGGITELE